MQPGGMVNDVEEKAMKPKDGFKKGG